MDDKWGVERPEWGECGRWNASQWDARSRWIAARLDPRAASLLHMAVAIQYGDRRDVSLRYCWFDPDIGTTGYWIVEDSVMKEEWPDLLPQWHEIQAAAVGRRCLSQERLCASSSSNTPSAAPER